jgi:peptidoglycan/xylan/chitin deacetylase (PgdA/CDA1 family)
LPPKSVTITFDDGGYDFHRRAFPLLQKYGLPATVYLTTFYCRCPRPVLPIFFNYLLWKARNTFRGNSVLGLGCPVNLHQKTGRQVIIDAIVKYAQERKMPLMDRQELAGKLASELGLDFQEILSKRILQLMTPQEVAGLSAQGLDVQLHTHRHRTPMDRDLFIREITDNRTIIQEITGVYPSHFCYPSGVYHQAFLPWLEQEGVVSATTCESGLATRSSSPLLLPRIVDTSNLSELELQGALDGVTTGVKASWLRGA